MQKFLGRFCTQHMYGTLFQNHYLCLLEINLLLSDKHLYKIWLFIKYIKSFRNENWFKKWLLVYQGKALNVQFRLSLNSHQIVLGKRKYWKPINFGEYQSVKFWAVQNYYDQLASLSSICNIFVVHDNSPRIINSHYALSIMNNLFKARII